MMQQLIALTTTTSKDFSYRTRDEVEEVRKTRDAINGFKAKIIPAGLVSEDELKEIDKKIRMKVNISNFSNPYI